VPKGKPYKKTGPFGRQPVVVALLDRPEPMTTVDLLEAAGWPVSQGSFSGYANGHRMPLPKVAQSFADVLGVPVDELFVGLRPERR
jgi:hypothetical protein